MRSAPRRTPCRPFLLVVWLIAALLAWRVVFWTARGTPIPASTRSSGVSTLPELEVVAVEEAEESNVSQPLFTWSLQDAVTLKLLTAPLAYHYGYAALGSNWDAWALIKPLLGEGGYIIPPKEQLEYVGHPAVLVVANYWKPGAIDWRTYRLAPFQRVNRFWGMEVISKKDAVRDCRI